MSIPFSNTDVSIAPLILPTVPQELPQLEAWVRSQETKQAQIKEDNEARIVWYRPTNPQHTEWGMVYLHGFSASQGEGEPQHRRLAQLFGCNLYLARLPGHGLVADDAMSGLTAQTLVDAAAQALAIGQAIGKKVILIGASMGASLAIYLAARQPDAIAAIIAWSPGVRPYDESVLRDLCKPGETIYHDVHSRSAAQLQYWSSAVHRDGYRSLADLFYGAMTPTTFSHVRCPFFLAYFYRDENYQDKTASVSAMLTMYQKLGTPAPLKRSQAFPDGAHVIGSPWRSPAAEQVFNATCDFLVEVVGLEPLKPLAQ